MIFHHRHLPRGHGSLLPGWLQIVYVWLCITVPTAFVSWLGFRALAGVVRGDILYAMISLGIGVVVATIITRAVFGRKSKR